MKFVVQLYNKFPYTVDENHFLPYLDEVGKIDEEIDEESGDESCDVAEDQTTKEKQKRQAERLKQLKKKKLSKETYRGI